MSYSLMLMFIFMIYNILFLYFLPTVSIYGGDLLLNVTCNSIAVMFMA